MILQDLIFDHALDYRYNQIIFYVSLDLLGKMCNTFR